MATMATTNAAVTSLDSTEALFGSTITPLSAYKSMKTGSLELVARDGIEPPTPAFSGLEPTALIFLIPFFLSPLFKAHNSDLLGPHWDQFLLHHSGQSRELIHHPPFRLRNELLIHI